MKTRILTGLVLGLFMISGMLYSFFTCLMLFVIICAFSHQEWQKNFLINESKLTKTIYTVFFLVCLCLLIFVEQLNFANKLNEWLPYFNSSVILILALFGIPLYLNKNWKFTQSWYCGIFYIYFPMIVGIYFLHQDFETNRWLILGLIIINWCNDSFAYFTGRLIGRTPLAPSISPKKTIEGAVGGIAFGILAAYLLNTYMFQQPYPIEKIIVLGVAVCIAGITGDLYESRMKRLAGIKDSGNLLPGHGGFLDRFDSFFYIIPVGIFVLSI